MAVKKSIIAVLFIAVLLVAVAFNADATVFDDVNESDWFYNYVYEAYNFGFVNRPPSSPP